MQMNALHSTVLSFEKSNSATISMKIARASCWQQIFKVLVWRLHYWKMNEN